ncbi:MAG: hypothetical protein IKZ53_06360 [Selenomonadaceae bacterium]|nr:hypothetical protein [Selenomonadaceae bacterium]
MVNLDYLYNPDTAKPQFDRNYFLDKKLGFQVIENGTIIPYKKIVDSKKTPDGWGFGGIVDGEGKFIKSSHVVSGAGSIYTPPQNQLKTAPKLLYISECFTVHGDMP